MCWGERKSRLFLLQHERSTNFRFYVYRGRNVIRNFRIKNRCAYTAHFNEWWSCRSGPPGLSRLEHFYDWTNEISSVDSEFCERIHVIYVESTRNNSVTNWLYAQNIFWFIISHSKYILYILLNVRVRWSLIYLIFILVSSFVIPYIIDSVFLRFSGLHPNYYLKNVSKTNQSLWESNEVQERKVSWRNSCLNANDLANSVYVSEEIVWRCIQCFDP